MELLVIIAVVAFVVSRRARRNRLDEPLRRAAIDYGELSSVAGAKWSVARPLARVEARRLFWHPAFLFGVVITPAMILLSVSGESNDLNHEAQAVALALVPLGWMAIIGANLCTLRAKRAGAEELMVTLPAPGGPRTLGHVFAAGTALVSASIASLVAAVVLSAQDDAFGSISAAEVAAGVLIATGGAVVGVVVARWLPHAAWGVAAVAVVTLLQARFLDPSTWPWSGDEASQARFLGFLAPRTSVVDPMLELRAPGWHLVYLAALTALIAAIAVLRHSATRGVIAVTLAALAVAVISGWVQTRPLDAAQAQAMVDYLTHPREHQTCEQHGSVQYCEFSTIPSHRGAWRERTEAVLSVLPPTIAARPLEVIQRPPTIIGNSDCEPMWYADALPSSVLTRLSVNDVWAADGKVHPPLRADSLSCSDEDLGHLFTAVQVGSWAVGLPPAPAGKDERCGADGQARAVIALWLGAQATPGGFETLRRIVDEYGPALTFDGWDSPPMWGVRWRGAEMDAAIALADLPSERGRALFSDHWPELTSRDTPVARIFELLGRPAPNGAATSIIPVSARSCP